MTLSDVSPPAAQINYPPVPRSRAVLAVQNTQLNSPHADLIKAMGATVTRCQMAWSDIQNPTTGVFALTAGETSYLQYLGTQGIQPLIVAAFGPPWTTLGTLTVNTIVPAGSPGGTPIPVNSYGFAIAPNSTDFAGGLNTSTGGLSSVSAYYGDIISAASSTSIQIGATLTQDLNPGDTITIQRLRYAPPFTDADASIAAYVSYVQFLANQIVANGCTGYVDVWNEFVWANDRWTAAATFYDVKPSFITNSPGMSGIQAALQAMTLPAGVKLVNGVSDKSGSNSIASRNLTGTNFSHDSIHTYHNDPEGWCISPFGWGSTIGKFQPPASWPTGHTSDAAWDCVIPVDVTGNFRNVLFNNEFKPGGPFAQDVMITESGFSTNNDAQQARWISRMVLANWGNGYPVVNVFELDNNSVVGSTTYSLAPRSTPRQSYTALQRIMAVIGRMDTATAQTAPPVIVGWPSAANPLMSTTIAGNQTGNFVLFVWQRTWANTANWAAIDTPTTRPASVFLPDGLVVAEATNVVSGATVSTTTVNATLITVPVADDPIAIRFAPA